MSSSQVEGNIVYFWMIKGKHEGQFGKMEPCVNRKEEKLSILTKKKSTKYKGEKQSKGYGINTSQPYAEDDQ